MPRFQLQYSFEAESAAEARRLLFSGAPPASHTIRRVDHKLRFAKSCFIGILCAFWAGVGILICSACQRSGVRFP